MKDATLKELRPLFANHEPVATPSELQSIPWKFFLNPGFQSKPWAGISERFQRNDVQVEERSYRLSRGTRRRANPWFYYSRFTIDDLLTLSLPLNPPCDKCSEHQDQR
jgi:hypothetical protein